ncbi:MAG: sigma-54-dependent Fis family transcriptional regulator [Planctomycetaceae bacterium]|nr:sigma-54-dependent Fis family transcriptional regulator [Planctomycetaceae bacterium]MCP4477976.1 sigma-54-dependent Fis family transcriptional regulator [Planctomycetaceae bacterium]
MTDDTDNFPPRILIVDDQQSMCEMLVDTLTPNGFDVEWKTKATEAIELLKDQVFDVVLTDLKMPDMNGIEFCQEINRNHPEVPVVVMTAFGSFEAAVSAIRAGAFDFVTKPLEMDLLDIALARAVKQSRLQQQVRRLKTSLDIGVSFGELIGKSPAMRNLYKQLSQVAAVDTTVLITGESGSGKELAAHSVHQHSKRRDKPFVAINCAALPESLMESELFGHVAGAFTGADQDHDGLLVRANGGTLFLDEIGEMSPSMQPKLLRALEANCVRPVGGIDEIPFDARLVAATNRDLETAVEAGTFREDLFYRINVVPIHLPPLRQRSSDILILAQFFVKLFSEKSEVEIKEITETVAQRLLDYQWPGNVRELRNAMERAVTLSDGKKLRIEDLPESIRNYQSRTMVIASDKPEELRSLEEVEKRYILHVLDTVDGNRTLASKILGLDRKTLYRKLIRYEQTGSEQPTE